MKQSLFILVLSLFTANAHAAGIFEDNISDIAEQSKIMDFYSCKDYVSQAVKNHSSTVLEDTPNIYKIKVWTDDAGIIITCTHTIIGTKH